MVVVYNKGKAAVIAEGFKIISEPMCNGVAILDCQYSLLALLPSGETTVIAESEWEPLNGRPWHQEPEKSAERDKLQKILDAAIAALLRNAEVFNIDEVA